ncbi:hypothetical protein SEMRO_1663_G289430.1 [Seminavis robusta]|uniref:DUF6824 domain-containing protein n=1 Tax=Seminavis robusta TaxID=568900 RepID=A0A9N8ERA0_9STRA|nr:hypothetical protein SEMRO_1663_G289430.1 [Seminavis robusta]|eukprot:Sro1663_g289430.1 n/a (330) ;mRNA; r:5482-6471
MPYYTYNSNGNGYSNCNPPSPRTGTGFCDEEGTYLDPVSNKIVFPDDFCPGINFVVCGRGKRSYGHYGNKHFAKEIVSRHIQEYSFAKTKQEKSAIVQTIVNEVESVGGFIRYDSKLRRYVRAEDNIGREKTSQALRDCIQSKYKSSKDIKRETRKQKRLARAARETRVEAPESTEESSDASSSEDEGEQREPAPSVEPTKPAEKRSCPEGLLMPQQQQFKPLSISEGNTTLQTLINRLRVAEVMALPVLGNGNNNMNRHGYTFNSMNLNTSIQQSPQSAFANFNAGPANCLGGDTNCNDLVFQPAEPQDPFDLLSLEVGEVDLFESML